MNQPPYNTTQQGLGLVELMISITISLVIMAGVVQLFVSSNKTAITAQGASRLQENVRYALNRIGDDIARAGNMGCLSFSAAGPAQIDNTVMVGGFPRIDSYVYNRLPNNIAAAATKAGNGVLGIPDDTAWSDFEGSFISGVDEDNSNANILDGTDSLIVKYADGAAAVEITNATGVASSILSVNDASGFSVGNIVFAGNCKEVYVFQVGAVDSGANTITVVGNTHSISSHNEIPYIYGGNSGAYEYYIGSNANGICAANGAGRANCSLFRSINGIAQELVVGVHGLEISYGYENVLQDTVATNGRLTIDRVQVTMDFNALDTTQTNNNNLLTKTITRVFAVQNQL